MDVTELREKYTSLERLRRARRLEPERAPPLDEIRALAHRFPGALRELERLPLEVVIERGRELDNVLVGAAQEPLWAMAQRCFHAQLRGALEVKRGLLQPGVTPAFPQDAEPFLLCAAEVARPPGRKLTTWIIRRVAEELGVHQEECRRLLFPWDGER